MTGVFGNWLVAHARDSLGALGTLSRQPAGSLLTIIVVAIALALPGAMNVLVQSGRVLAGNWDDIRDFSVFLKPGTAPDTAARLEAELSGADGIEAVRLITDAEALDDMGGSSAYGELLAALDENPLPHTLIVRPAPDMPPESLNALAEELRGRDTVDIVRLDTLWLERLDAMLDFVRRGTWITAVLLLLAVVVIVGNTIRLEIQNRRLDIEIAKLLGAGDAFVRRPFLWLGFWYGCLGGLLALLLMAGSLWLLGHPLERLAALYEADFRPGTAGAETMLAVLAGGLAAGIGGAWNAVARHLAAIRPDI